MVRFTAKRLKNGQLRIKDNETKGFTDLPSKTEEKRRLPILLQVCGLTPAEIEIFMKEIE